MKSILITSNNLSLVFQQIKEQLGGKLEIKSKEFRLEVNNDLALGCISGIMVENAISYMEYDIVFKENVSLVKKINNSDSIIHFGYCSKGQIIQSFGEFNTTNLISQFQTGIFSNASTKSTFLKFTKNKEVKFSMITVDALSVSDTELKNQLRGTFLINQENNVFSYIGSLNLKIAEKIDYLNTINQKGLIRNLLINSTVYLILALEIEQHKHDLVNGNTSNSLSQSDMEAIKDVSELIRNYPEIQYSLRYLSKKSGLSPFKLQEGFKVMHNRTVTDFIRNVRVEAAENLIRTSELNISEIVYTIGLTSRSYFSKIFKAKYNCSPKYYQNQQNRLVITA